MLAHAGGWDEMLMIGVPLALFVLFRWLASRRRSTEEEEDQGAAREHDEERT